MHVGIIKAASANIRLRTVCTAKFENALLRNLARYGRNNCSHRRLSAALAGLQTILDILDLIITWALAAA